MADRIKGITVTIGGDVTGLNKALASTNKEIKSTQSQLKDVERLLKLDPKNTELLQQKQKLLSQAVGETKNKLDALKEAEKQVQQQVANGTASQEQYDSLKREIIDTEESLKSLKKQSKEFGSVTSAVLKQTGEDMQKFGKKIGDVGKDLSLKVTAPLAAVGTIAVKTAADFESAMSKVEALSGATAEEMEKLKAKAQEMGATTAFSASESADAMSYMALAGWSASEMVDGIAGIMDLAAASGENLANTSDIVTDALTAFGLSAADSARFADVLATTSASSNTDVAGLGEAFKQCSALAGAMGYSVEDVTLALGTMANAGIKGSTAGTALKNTIANLSKPTDNQAAAMQKLGISLTDSAGNMKSLDSLIGEIRTSFDGLTEDQTAAYAATLFGKESMAGMISIINASEEDYNSLSDAINNATGSSAEMADTMLNNLNGQMTLLKSAVEGGAISIGEALIPMISKLVEKVQGAVDWFNSLDTSQKNMIVTILAVAAAIGPTLLLLGGLVSIIGKIVLMVSTVSGAYALYTGAATSASVASTALAGVMTFLAANPIVLVIAAIAALIAGFMLLWNKCDAFREFFINMWKGICSAVDATVSWIGSALETIGVFFSNLWKGVKEGAISCINFIINGINSLISSALEPLNVLIRGANLIPGVNIPALNFAIPNIPMLAKGGTVLNGSAIVGEAGAELLTVQNGKTTVTPLNGASGLKAGQTINLNATFYGYKQADGLACARDLNRQLGRLYG